MILAFLLSLLAGSGFCLLVFTYLGLPLQMAFLYFAGGATASLVVLHLATRKDPLRRLGRYYVLGGVTGAAVGLLTNGLLAFRFKYLVDAAGISAVLGGLGAVLYAIMLVATDRAPRTKVDRSHEEEYVDRLREAARGESGNRD